MALNQLPPPVPFPAIPGDPPVPWYRCFQSFQTYLIAYGLDDKSVSDARPREILSHCLSTEGQRVFSSFDASSDSREGSTAIQNRNSGPKHSIIMSRYNFRQRSQQAGESVIQFVAALRELSTLCNFGGLCEEMIRDKFIEKTSVNRIRERRAIQLALQVEMLARTLQPSQVQHVSLKPLRAHRDWKHPPPLAAQPSSARSGRSSGKWWTNCGFYFCFPISYALSRDAERQFGGRRWTLTWSSWSSSVKPTYEAESQSSLCNLPYSPFHGTPVHGNILE